MLVTKISIMSFNNLIPVYCSTIIAEKITIIPMSVYAATCVRITEAKIKSFLFLFLIL